MKAFFFLLWVLLNKYNRKPLVVTRFLLQVQPEMGEEERLGRPALQN